MLRRTVLASLSLAVAVAAVSPSEARPQEAPPSQPATAPAPAPTAAPAQAPGSAIPSSAIPGSAIRAAFDAASRSPEQIAAATQEAVAIAQAYRTFATLTDTITLDIDAAGSKQRETFAIAFGKGTDARFALAGATMVASGASVTVVPDVPADKALRVPLEGDLMTTLKKALPGFATPVTLFDLRAGRPLTVEALGMAALVNPRIAGLREADGQRFLLIDGDNGASEVGFRSDSKLFTTSRLSFTPPDAPPGFLFEIQLAHATEVAEELRAPIEADVTGRTIVASIEELLPSRQLVQVGERSPAWSLRASDGSMVSLEGLRSNVVVISFWATWCGPCKRTLPYVDEFARWAAESGKPIRVFGVNSLESGDADARVREANAWWSGQKFTMPLLLDLDDGVADGLGVRVLPMTIVIGPDGVVRSIQQSFDPREPGKLVEDLKKAAEAALATP